MTLTPSPLSSTPCIFKYWRYTYYKIQIVPDLKFTYDTYQDVRRNLFLYAMPFLVVAGFFTFFCVLPPDHQSAVVKLLDCLEFTAERNRGCRCWIGRLHCLGVSNDGAIPDS